MLFRPISLTFFGCLFSFSAASMAVQPLPEHSETEDSTKILNAHYALYQGDTAVAEQLIRLQSNQDEINEESLALQKLQIMVWVKQEEVDKATESLLDLQKQNSNNADLYFFSAGAWKELAHQVSVFSKIKYYSRAVEAYIRAGELAPNNAKYVRKQASSYAQPEMFGGQEGKQKPMLAKIQELDIRYGLVASMDLAQNAQDHEKANQLSEQAILEYSDSFVLVERAAQMQWTLKNDTRAQQLFLQACNFPAQIKSDRLVWITSCYTVVYLSLNNDNNHALALTAMQRLLSVNTLKTAENDQAKLYLAEMAKKAGNKTLALTTYRELAKESVNKKIRKKARKALKKMS